VIEWLVERFVVASEHDHEKSDECFVGLATFDWDEDRPLGGIVHDEHHAFLAIYLEDVGAPRILSPGLENGHVFKAQINAQLLGKCR